MAFMASGGYTGIGAQVPNVKVRCHVAGHNSQTFHD